MVDADSTVPHKRCTKCQQDKPATSEFFHACKRSPDGRRSVCCACRAADHAEHRDERLPKRREHYQANKDRLLANVRAYYQENAEAQRKAALARHYRNRERRLPQMRAYQQENRDTLLAKKRVRGKQEWLERYGQDLAYTLKHRVGSLLRITLKHARKSRRMEELLGFTTEELMAHLERQFTKGMSWERLLAGEIEIDHIVPVKSFNITSDDSPEFRACWALSNLRPMWSSENRSKGAKVLTLL